MFVCLSVFFFFSLHLQKREAVKIPSWRFYHIEIELETQQSSLSIGAAGTGTRKQREPLSVLPNPPGAARCPGRCRSPWLTLCSALLLLFPKVPSSSPTWWCWLLPASPSSFWRSPWGSSLARAPSRCGKLSPPCKVSGTAAAPPGCFWGAPPAGLPLGWCFFSSLRLRHRDVDHLRSDSHILQHYPVLHSFLPFCLLCTRSPLGVL